APSPSHPLHLAPGSPAPPSGYLQPASTRTPLALLLCSRDRLGLLPIHIPAKRRGTHPTIKKNNLRVVGKAPCTQLTWQKIHKATGNNNVNPRAGRCRCIFTAGVDAAGEESLGKHCARSGALSVVLNLSLCLSKCLCVSHSAPLHLQVVLQNSAVGYASAE
ncbi:hypothetical protein JOQ06_017906, partial [Pogonophryne albipinna]